MKNNGLFEEFEETRKHFEFTKKHERGHFIVSKDNMDTLLRGLDYLLASEIKPKNLNQQRKRARK